ncbi:MAG TPA: M20/M25/M40 family metallo-hydrolase [Candidatus Saccharimonadales bacterium]|nr:M20/M25/M40 family metallo-hydrolase [Candidatus Saccharimonadales bacterium]
MSSPTKRSAWVDFSSRLVAKWRLNTQDVKQSAEPELVGMLSDLVSLPTVTGQYDANHDALDYIERFVAERGMHVVRHEWNGVESLIATTKVTKTPTVMLAAHIDVLPAPEASFQLTEKDGKLYGRGVLDMKFAIATYLKLVDSLADNLQDYDFGIMITTDEEAGGYDGVVRLIEAGYIPKVCVLPDGGDNWQVQIHAKGALGFTLSATGKASHGSRPWLGENAVLRLMDAIRDIYALFPEHMGPRTNTVSIGKIQGGNAINQVADSAELLLDVRVLTEAEHARLLAEIEAICERHDVQAALTWDIPVTEFDLKDPYIKPFADIIQEVTGTVVKGSRTTGTNDIRFFKPHNTPCISFYPPGDGHHGPIEWIDKQALYDTAEIVEQYIRRMAKVQP